ncbi:MAG TPA: peptidase MA family metallohydrolase [Chloroflexota bacterium]|nr:peptidase MA family metallohydrolase [Chloroflexota bacterium]
MIGLFGRWGTLAFGRFFGVVVLTLAMGTLLHLPGLATAAEPATARLVAVHEARFPSDIVFRLNVESDHPIADAALYYRVGDEKSTVYARVAVPRARHTTAFYRLDLQKNYLPPGSELQYHWVVDDELGNRTRGDPSKLTVNDERFHWNRASSGLVSVFWYQGDASFGRAAIDAATQALSRLAVDTGIHLARPVNILVYANPSDFMGATSSRVHDWAGGVAFPEQRVIILLAPPTAAGLDSARRAIAHELSHVLTHQATDNPYGDIPRWLDEGLATLAEGELHPSFVATLERAIQSDSLISVRSLGSVFPTDPEQASLSYAQSYSVVRHIIDRHGQAKITRLLDAFREGATYDEALQAAIGLDVDQLDDEWRVAVGGNSLTQASPGLEESTTETSRNILGRVSELVEAFRLWAINALTPAPDRQSTITPSPVTWI